MTIAARYEIEHLQYLGADGALVNEPPADLVDTKLLLPLFKQMLFVRVFDTKAIALQKASSASECSETLSARAKSLTCFSVASPRPRFGTLTMRSNARPSSGWLTRRR